MNFEEWLEAVQGRITALAEYGKSPPPLDSVERHGDTDAAIRMHDEISRLICDAKEFLTHEKAVVMLEVKAKHKDLSVKEREKIEDDLLREKQRILDGLLVTERTIRSRYFSFRDKNK